MAGSPKPAFQRVTVSVGHVYWQQVCAEYQQAATVAWQIKVTQVVSDLVNPQQTLVSYSAER